MFGPLTQGFVHMTAEQFDLDASDDVIEISKTF